MNDMEHMRELGRKLEDTAQKQRLTFAEEYAREQGPLEPDEQVTKYEDRRGK